MHLEKKINKKIYKTNKQLFKNGSTSLKINEKRKGTIESLNKINCFNFIQLTCSSFISF